jgi:biotin carboxyl carrier protein
MKNFKFKIKDNTYEVEIVSVEEKIARVNVNGEMYEVEVDQMLRTTKTPTLLRSVAVPSTESTPSTARTANPSEPNGAGVMKSPLPGKILDIFVKQGDHVSLGERILCLEAMKMENNINSQREGTVTAIHVQKGDSVLEGDILVEIN